MCGYLSSRSGSRPLSNTLLLIGIREQSKARESIVKRAATTIGEGDVHRCAALAPSPLLVPLAPSCTTLPARRGIGARPAAAVHRAGFRQSTGRRTRPEITPPRRPAGLEMDGDDELALRSHASRARDDELGVHVGRRGLMREEGRQDEARRMGMEGLQQVHRPQKILRCVCGDLGASFARRARRSAVDGACSWYTFSSPQKPHVRIPRKVLTPAITPSGRR